MEHKDNILKGMTAAIAAFFMFAVMHTMAKILSESYHVIEIAFYRNLIATIPFLFMIFILGKHDIPKIKQRKTGVIARAVIGTISLILTFAAFSAMPMADATSFIFTASLLTPILGFIFLKEKVGTYRVSAIIVGFIGILIMLNPTGNVALMGAAIALSAAFLHALLQTILRHIGKTENPITIVFYFVSVGTVICGIMLPWVAIVPAWEDVLLFLAVGITGVLAQYLLSVAFSYAPAAVVTVFNYSGLIWATLFGWFVWSDFPSNAVIIGGGIIITSNIFVIWREHKIDKNQKSLNTM